MKYKIRKMGSDKVLSQGVMLKAITFSTPVIVEWVGCFGNEICVTVSNNASKVTESNGDSFLTVS